MDNKKQDFKNFVAKHPELIDFVKDKDKSWQDFYEIYDLYGEDESAWDRYTSGKDRGILDGGATEKIKELTGLFKNINMDNVQKHVNNAQKAINIIQELTQKSPEVVVKTARPITKFYGD